MNTKQVEFWNSEFGQQYTDRNTPEDFQTWNMGYVERYGVSRIEMFEYFVKDWNRGMKILEVGCNTGLQLVALQKLGFYNLYGVELQQYAVEKAKHTTKAINIIQGNAFEIPFKDAYFDMVMTNGVLIHIAPDDLYKAFNEIIRCTKKYVLGFEYFAEENTEIEYRGNKGFLWKDDYATLYSEHFARIKTVKEMRFPYIIESEKNNTDSMFLLEKI